MVFIRKHKILNDAFYQIQTEHDNVLLDYHAGIYGKNHRLPSFESPPKSIKFIVKVIENCKHLFITSAESLGCLFTDESVKIYCTNPVYEQIMLKYEEYLRLSLTYDEEICNNVNNDKLNNNKISEINSQHTNSGINIQNSGMNIQYYQSSQFYMINNEKYKIVSIEEINCESFKKKIHFLAYNEPIALYGLKIMAMQPGTFLGWINYKMVFANEKSLYYLTSYSEKPRFSSESVKIEADYLIINRSAMFKTNDLQMFSELLHKICLISEEGKDNNIIIPLPIETLFIEILLHTLSIVQYCNIPIYVVSPLYKKVELLVNIQSEWLKSSVCMSEEPFPIREYNYLYPIDTFNNEYKQGGEGKNKIIFCSDLAYKYKTKNKIFAKQLDILINNKDETGERINENVMIKINEKFYSENYYEKVKFDIKIENSIEEITRSTQAIIIDEEFFFIKTTTDYCYMNVNGSLNLINNKLFLSGDFLFTDKYSVNQLNIYIKNKKSLLKRLLETKEYVIIDNSIIFYNKRMKFRIINNEQIEYENY